MNSWTWRPTSEEAFREIFEDELYELSQMERTIFEEYRVKTFAGIIRRSEIAGDEQVFVVARHLNWVIYYDDVEDGFNLAQLDSQGRLSEPGGGQWSLGGALEGQINIAKN